MNLDKIAKVTKGKTRTSGISPFSELELDKVYPNPLQPRKNFTGVAELAAQIAKDGLLQPIAVVKREDGYMIVSGERRYHAHLMIDAKTIKAHIITADDAKVQELALIENIQREDLTPYEVATYITKLWASGNYTQKSDLAEAVGKPPSFISKAFKAVKLSPQIIANIEESKSEIGLEILQELSRIKDEDTQLELYSSGATREQIRDAATNQSGKISPAKKENNNETPKDHFTFTFENEAVFFDTNYKVIKGGFTNGGAQMDFYIMGLNCFLKKNKQYKITIEEI